MKINVINGLKSSLTPLPSDKTKQIVEILEASSIFEKFVKEQRELHSIPKRGYKRTGKKQAPNDIFIQLNEPTTNFVEKLNFPSSWIMPIMHFIIYNSLLTPIDESISLFPNAAYDGKEWWDIQDFDLPGSENKQESIGHFLHIIITQNINKQQLHKFIDDNWDKIEWLIKTFPKNLINQKRDINLDQKIYEIRNSINPKTEKRYTFPEVLEILDKEFQSDQSTYFRLNESNIKMRYYRWLEKINLSTKK